MNAQTVLRVPRLVRQPLGALLVRLPVPDAKLLGFALSPAIRSEPWPLYRQLRETYPVHRTGFAAWTIARHRDVATLARHPHVSVEEANATAFPHPPDTPFSSLMGQTMLFRDAPDHDRLRRLVARAFTPARIQQLRPRVETLAASRLDQLAPLGQVDLLAELAYPLPVDVVCELLGIPDADRHLFPIWAKALAARLDLEPMRTPTTNRTGDAAALELTAYLEGLLNTPSRRIEGGLIDGLVDAEESGERLEHAEVIATCALLLVAGHETTANLIANGVLALLRHPDQLAELRDGHVVAETAVEELLRYDGPVQLTQRIALADLIVDGITIPAGELIVLLVGAANRDPEVFDEPDQLNLARNPNHHLAFSTGIHACLGAALARMETAVVLEQLLIRLPGLRLAAQPRWRDTFVLRGLQSLPVAWTASRTTWRDDYDDHAC